MLSLNAGVELDNELIDANQEAGKELDQMMFADVVAGEVPELRSDVDIEALVTRLRALDYTQNNLESIGGINQQFVMESQALVPGLVTDTVPVEFYTQDVTKTRYTFALEAISAERTKLEQLIARSTPVSPKANQGAVIELLIQQNDNA